MVARRERALQLRREYATPRNLSSVEVDVVLPEDQQTPGQERKTSKATVVVREGDVLESVVRAFMVAHSLLDSAFGVLVAALKREVRPRAKLLAAVPVIVPAGAKGVMAVREGDNVTVWGAPVGIAERRKPEAVLQVMRSRTRSFVCLFDEATRMARKRTTSFLKFLVSTL